MVTYPSSRAARPRLSSVLSAVTLAVALGLAGSSQAQSSPPAPATSVPSRPAPSSSGSTSAPAPVASGSAAASGSAPGAPATSASAVASGSAPAAVSLAPSPGPAPVPHFLHAPPAAAFSGEPLVIEGNLEFPDRIRRALLVYREGSGAEREVEFRRAQKGPYAAQTGVLAGAAVAYCIELELVDGQRVAVFASRGAMHEVQVRDPEPVRQEKAALEQVGGRRSVVTSLVEYVHFGRVTADVISEAGTLERRTIDDRYYRIEAGYTYRMLGTIAEFGIRGGMVRGRSLVPGQMDPSKYDVGLNYGAPTIRLRAGDGVHFEGTLLTSVTEIGFSTGGGGAMILGNPYGRRLMLGFESIQTFGTRFYSRLDLSLPHGIGIAPMVEVTNMPHADRYGVRLLSELSFQLGGGLQAAARLGYQARDADSGGLSGGASVSYAF